jgi:hypothetical protein
LTSPKFALAAEQAQSLREGRKVSERAMTSPTSFSIKTVTRDQSRDTGMAMVLLLLLIFLKTRRNGLLYAAVGLQVMDMILPRFYAPAAVAWLGLSSLLGTVMSRVLLSILFFGLVTPIGLARRLFGKDSLKLRAFKASEDSAMIVRNHIFVGADIEKPY